ncbi:MAG: alpha/beta hydrolase [Chloroflexales bacterium]|nr:alpha/beta hydrolase [Chloroflexales bacterium]
MTGVLGLVGLLLFWSYPGKPAPFLDKDGKPLPGSLAEKIYVPINGVEQGMFIISKNTSNPVLLYLHGGMPDYFLTKDYPTGLEEYFTIVWWEQRGIGMSYRPDIPAESLTAEQYIADTLAVTNYLRQRFGKEKIYLMAHSGGTFFGIQVAAQHPEFYHAYIGMAQMANQRKSEQLAYDYMLAQYRANGNGAMVRKLEAAPVTVEEGTPAAYLAVRDEAMHALGVGTIHEMKSVIDGVFVRSLQSPQYTLDEKIRLWRGKAQSGVNILWKTVMVTDLAKEVPELKIPVYFFEGVYDYTCAYSVAKEYFAQLRAPVKGFYTFEQPAHSPIFEEPEKAQQIIREDVLAGTSRLADSK